MNYYSRHMSVPFYFGGQHVFVPLSRAAQTLLPFFYFCGQQLNHGSRCVSVSLSRTVSIYLSACYQRSVQTCLPLSTTVSICLSAYVNNSQYIPVCLCQQWSVYTCLPLSTVSIYLSASFDNGQYIPVCLYHQWSVYTCLPMSSTVNIYLSACHQRSIIRVRLHQQRSIRVCFLVSCGSCVSVQPPTGMRVPQHLRTARESISCAQNDTVRHK